MCYGGNFTTICIRFGDLSGSLGDDNVDDSEDVTWKCNFALRESFPDFSMLCGLL